MPDQGRGADLKPQVEAALFAASEPLSIDQLAELLGAGKRAVRSALEALVAEYVSRPDSALEIALDEGFLLSVKPLYQKVVDRLLPSDLPQGSLRTLSLIAAKAPVLQSEVVAARGSGAYDHIKELVARGLIEKAASGNSFELRVGPRFGDYFRLAADQVGPALEGMKSAATGKGKAKARKRPKKG